VTKCHSEACKEIHSKSYTSTIIGHEQFIEDLHRFLWRFCFSWYSLDTTWLLLHLISCVWLEGSCTFQYKPHQLLFQGECM